jgi:hypothetical protein
MLLPTDDSNWALEDSPVKDKDERTQQDQQQFAQQDQPRPGVLGRIGNAITGVFNGSQQQGQPVQPVVAPAKTNIERASEVISDWHSECGYNGEVRRVIESAARIGVGILKGPHPTKHRSRKTIQKDGAWGVEVEIKTSPASSYISAWNFYPDYPACGNDIQRGSFVFERDDITRKALSDLRGGELGYIDEMINMCLEEGPSPDTNEGKTKEYAPSETDMFEIWYYYGFVSKDDMEAAGCECSNEYEPCIVTMVNNRVIKITLSVLDTGEFPFDVMVWQDRLDHWAGIGVAEQISTCQISLKGAVRALQDNMALSSGPQVIVDSSKIEPADGKWVITPRKLWRKRVDSDGIDDVSKAFTIVSIETRQVELLNIINYWTKTAEEVTGLPMLLQGQVGGAPETLGGQQIVNNNGSTVLRRIVRTFDDRVTEPHLGRYYEYLLLHGPEYAKGDFIVRTRGSSALIERETKKQEIMQLLGASLNPAYDVNPAKVMTEVLKSWRFDPDNFGYTEEEKQAKAKQQPTEDPRITVEKLQATEEADHAVAAAQMELQRQRWESQEKERDRQNELVIAAINERMQSTQLSSGERQNLDKIKSTLAQTAAKLEVTKDLAVASHTVDLHKNKQAMAPVIEPVGRAPAGQSWQK